MILKGKQLAPAVCIPLVALMTGCIPVSSLNNTTTTGTIYFYVYNFYEKSVRAEITYRDKSGVYHTLPATKGTTSPIPKQSRGELDVLCTDMIDQADAQITITFTFPEDNNAVVTKTLLRSSVPCNGRARYGVMGPTDAQVAGFSEAAE